MVLTILIMIVIIERGPRFIANPKPLEVSTGPGDVINGFELDTFFDGFSSVQLPLMEESEYEYFVQQEKCP